MKTSILEIFKVGIGPSSSHTMGPMRAAADFVAMLGAQSSLVSVRRVQIDLYGSLALTGKGHGTDRAVVLGLCGEIPEKVDPETIESRLATFRSAQSVPLRGVQPVMFDESRDVLFRKDQTLSAHPNGMRFRAFDESGETLLEQVYYSIGGGFIWKEGEKLSRSDLAAVPYPFSSADELLQIGEERRMAIWQIVLQNEKSWRRETEIRDQVQRIWAIMQACVKRGLATEGILPGGLNVRRRAPRLAKKLSAKHKSEPLSPTDWVNAYAMAVNEENAAGGRRGYRPHERRGGCHPGGRTLLHGVCHRSLQ